MEKGSGLLLHISSLPSRYGIGTFGKEARKFIRFLNSSNQKYWQILPLNPTSFGDSPYQSFSAFAINPYFIDLELLYKKGYLDKEDLKGIKREKINRRVDYGYLYKTRFSLLKKASLKAYEFEAEKIIKFFNHEVKWLKDYALFMTIKNLNNGQAFYNWDKDLRLHKKYFLEQVFRKHNDDIKFWIYVQYEAFRQYKALKRYAKRKHVKIIGDMPIYVAADSCDVWANPKLFELDKSRKVTKVTGVPPDYFSENGQLWGNPVYKWDVMKKNHYAWWKKRFKMMSRLYDYIRIDHFRAFDSYYVISAKEETAKNGNWLKGPGIEFIDEIKKACPKINVVAEDLGDLSKSAHELLKQTGFPGLKVYQFAFYDYDKCLKTPLEDLKLEKDELLLMDEKMLKERKLINPYLPHNYDENCVAYIGTHDNDVLSNYLLEHKEEIPFMMDYLHLNKESDIYDTLIGSLMRSRANVVIFTIQDLLKLDSSTRMNTPGKADGNWTFRVLRKELNKELSSWLKIMSLEADR